MDKDNVEDLVVEEEDGGGVRWWMVWQWMAVCWIVWWYLSTTLFLGLECGYLALETFY
jgi:hypothetical protein